MVQNGRFVGCCSHTRLLICNKKPYLQHLLVLKIGVFQSNLGVAVKKIKIVNVVNNRFTTKNPVFGLFLVI